MNGKCAALGHYAMTNINSSSPPHDRRRRSRSSSQDWHEYTPLSPIIQHHQYQQSPSRYESLSQFLHLGSDNSLLLSQSFLTNTAATTADNGIINHSQLALLNNNIMDEELVSYSSSALLAHHNRKSSRQRRLVRSIIGRYDSPCAILLGFTGIILLGSFLAFLFPSSSSSEEEEEDQQSSSSSSYWDSISNILGYTYFLSWTLSFYPQIITNYHHPEKAMKGLSLDFIVWNIIGFALYAVYTTSLRYSDVVRQEYADRFGGGGGDSGGVVHSDGSLDGLSMNTAMFNNVVFNTIFTITNNITNSNSTGDVAIPQVKTNDVAFAWHALILTIITFIQIIYNEKRVGINRSNEEFADVIVTTTSVYTTNNENRWVVDNVEQEGMRLEDSLGEDSFILNEDDFGHQQQQQQKQDNQDHPHNSSQPTYFTESDDNQRTKQAHNNNNKRWTKRISYMTELLIGVLILTCISFGSIIATNVDVGQKFNLLDFLYFLSYVKVGITAVKYIPQVMLNYQRKSTAGWAIWNILLDFSGGSLSIIQLIGDSFAQDGSWTGVIGNPAKLGLGLVSICFDVIFIVQHYVLYRNPAGVSMLSPWNDDDGDIDPTRSDHGAPLLGGIHSLM